MHIEPGLLAPAKLLLANITAAAVLSGHAVPLLRRPALWLRTVLAALFFTACMQAFHLKVGPSELHFVGAMPIYLLCGYLPCLFGFALGLGLQGLLFEPQDLLHLAVNSLSLIVPLMATHHTLGQRFKTGVADLKLTHILKLDALYYGGVTLMVGFWLANGQTATALSDWAAFAASYSALVALEPLLTWSLLHGVRRLAARLSPVARQRLAHCVDERLQVAA